MSLAQQYWQEGYEDGYEEGYEEGYKEGQLMALRWAVLEVLDVRFGAVPAGLRVAIEALEGEPALEMLRQKAVVCPSLEEFQLFEKWMIPALRMAV